MAASEKEKDVSDGEERSKENREREPVHSIRMKEAGKPLNVSHEEKRRGEKKKQDVTEDVTVSVACNAACCLSQKERCTYVSQVFAYVSALPFKQSS